jgi:hypothetical protein
MKDSIMTRQKWILKGLTGLFLVLLYLQGKASNNMVYVTVHLRDAIASDTLSLYIVNHLYYFDDNATAEIKTTKSSDGCFHFSYLMKGEMEYFVIKGANSAESSNGLKRGLSWLTPLIILEQGDNVKIKILARPNEPKVNANLYKRYKYEFSGAGSQKYKLLSELDSIKNAIGDKGLPLFTKGLKYQDPYLQSTLASLAYLKQQKTRVSSLFYAIAQADLLYENSDTRFSVIRQYFNEHRQDFLERELRLFRQSYNQNMDRLFKDIVVDSKGLENSYYYTRHIHAKLKTDVLINRGDGSSKEVFDKTVALYAGQVRERVLLFHLLYGTTDAKWNANYALMVSEDLIKSKDGKKELSKIRFRLNGGNFFGLTLTDTQGKTAPLGSLKDKVLVLDIWYSGCGGCTRFYQDVLSKVEKQLKGRDDVVFVSISADKNMDIWLKSVNSGNYTSDKALNLFTGGLGFKHPLIDNYKISLFPTLIILNRDGKLASFQEAELMYNADLLTEKIKQMAL